MSWKCQRQSKGLKCGHVNENRRRKCVECGKPRPPRKRPDHLTVLQNTTYEECVELFGEECGICGALPKDGRRHHRDHEHVAFGAIRGILCFRCNSALRSYLTLEWLRQAVAYLERFEERREEAA
jgi:hypothetical protein